MVISIKNVDWSIRKYLKKIVLWMKKWRILVKNMKVIKYMKISGIFSDNCRVTLDETDSWMRIFHINSKPKYNLKTKVWKWSLFLASIVEVKLDILSKMMMAQDKYKEFFYETIYSQEELM